VCERLDRLCIRYSRIFANPGNSERSRQYRSWRSEGRLLSRQHRSQRNTRERRAFFLSKLLCVPKFTSSHGGGCQGLGGGWAPAMAKGLGQQARARGRDEDRPDHGRARGRRDGGVRRVGRARRVRAREASERGGPGIDSGGARSRRPYVPHPPPRAHDPLLAEPALPV
ncbi:unnamed protein product, partial [Laminaria digitata]